MKILSQSCVKPNNDVFEDGKERENEDAHIVRFENKLLAIADGAGGTGIFARKWADTILANLPEYPFENSEILDNWIGTFWENFYNEQIKASEHLFYAVKNKFLEEGSCTTLLAVWLAEKEFTCVSYGDSQLVIWEIEKKELVFFPYQTLLAFEQNPFLINWNTNIHAQGFQKKTFQIEPNKKYCLVSDALAQYLFCVNLVVNYREEAQQLSQNLTFKNAPYLAALLEQDIKIDEIMQNLENALQTSSSFEHYLYQNYENHFLLRDDYTCMMFFEG